MKRFKNMLFDNLTSSDCNDSTTGICHKNLSLDECEALIEDAQAHPIRSHKVGTLIEKEGTNSDTNATSGAGYFIDSDPTICVPINTNLHPYLNPSYRLRPSEEVLKGKADSNITTYAFINTKKYDFPPKNANSVFYNDRFHIKVGNSYLNKLGELTSNISHAGVFQFIRFQNTIEKDANYIPCRVNTLKIINIPGTNLILCNQDNNLVFKSALSSVTNKDNAFKFTPNMSKANSQNVSKANSQSSNVSNTSKANSPTINYNQKFYVTYQDVNYVGINEELNPNRLSIITKKDNAITFELIPLVDVYYCANTSALASPRIKKIPLKSCKTENEKASFDGMPVYRSKNCFGVCKKSQTLYILGFLILLLFFVAFSSILFHRL
jgi:hypothetical protein